jgi:hypothetical protein
VRKPSASTPGLGDRRGAISASSKITRGRRALFAFAALLGGVLAFASLAHASLGVVGRFSFEHKSCQGFICLQEDPGFFAHAVEAAVNGDGSGGASPGDLYVVDGGGNESGGRVQQFSTAGEFIRLWGPGVVKSGPGNAAETQAIRVDATGGTFKLGFGGDTTGDIAASATAAQVEAALNGLASIGGGGVSASGGPGNAGGTSPYLVSFDGGSLAGVDQPLLKATDGAVPLSGGAATVSAYTTNQGGSGFEICQPADGDECTYSNGGPDNLGGALFGPADAALNQSNGDLFVSDKNRVNEFSATGRFIRAWGNDVVASGPDDSGTDEQKSVTVKATGGTFTLAYRENPGSFFETRETTAPLPYDAFPAEVETALDGLAKIGGNYSSVSVTGGPGDLEGEHPYLITFHGLLGGDDLADSFSGGALGSNPNGLSSTSGTPSADVKTVANGGGYEICSANDACKVGAPGSATGAIGFGTTSGELGVGIEVAPAGAPNAGDVIVADDGSARVEEFTEAGSFVRMFGWNVDATDPSTGFEVCTAASGDLCKAGTPGVGVGQFPGEALRGVTEDSSGAIYTLDNTLSPFPADVHRVQKFTPAGGLDLAPSPFGTTETQALTVNAAAGQFRLRLGAGESSTPDLSFNAGASTVEAALNALPSISAGGGSVSVTGTAPYLISFDGGPLARTDQPQITPVQGTTPLSGGAGPGANTASVVTTVSGGPGGTSFKSASFDVATGPGGSVFVARYFQAGFTSCPDGSPSPAEARIEELSSSGAVTQTSDPCSGFLGSQEGVSSRQSGLSVNPSTGHPYLLAPISTSDFSFSEPLSVFGPHGEPPDLVLDPISKITPTGATISGTINPNGPGNGYPEATGTPSSYRTTYRVEYKKASESSWTKYSPDIPFGAGTSAVPFNIGVSGLAPKTPYELKVAAAKPFTGTTEEIKSFTTSGAPPAIEALSSAEVGAISADLHALINPQGTETTYHFEYGTTPAYGSETPETDIGEGLNGQAVIDHVEGLQDAVYHFRVVATNAEGTTTSKDQTFTFHPPVCPNQTVRQQTGATYLPDCRAYELVSPEDAGGTVLFTGGPQSPYATNPPRLAFVGQFADIPGAGRTPINTTGDLYLATRSADSWHTRYIGPSAEEAGCAGGRPIVSGTGPANTIQNDVIADQGLNRILDWNLGNPLECFSGWFGGIRFEDLNTAAQGSNAPYVWNANGGFVDRWPTEVADVTGSAANFSCPQDPSIHPYPEGFAGNIPVPYFCSTYVDASKDLSHFVFSTQSGLFGEGGLNTAPGSAYDNDTVHNTLKLISKLPGGAPIGQEPGAKAGAEELIQFPSVSTDGSHILMGTATKPACKQDNFPGGSSTGGPLCPIITQPTHLYVRVNDAVTYDVSAGKAVHYVGATPDGTKVYFTSDERLTADDTDSSTDLFMWEENGGAPQLTRISTGAPGLAGNTDACASTWTSDCDVKTYEDSRITTAKGNRGGLGAWDPSNPNPGYTDNAIAAKSGDVYFYSPEQLVEGKGGPGKENLYVYHQGAIQHVATLEDNPYCIEFLENEIEFRCSNGAVGRLQVTPDGRYAAFVTTSRITPYDNHGHAEMYRYDADAESLICVSCRSDGTAPEGEVLGSEGGRFITDDGRVFFDTPEPLDPRDTNTGHALEGQIEGMDIYEFVDGRAQLITTGTGTGGTTVGLSAVSVAGLYGVSGDGTDVYFGTSDTLVGQDRNGSQLKFYDARTNGGFPFVPLPAPCAAADECHGSSSSAPPPLVSGTGASLGAGGNARSVQRRRHHERKNHKRPKRGSHRASQHRLGGRR